MRVMVVGSGAREHALTWKIEQSPLCEELYCVPGNAGTEDISISAPIAAEDSDGLVKFAQKKNITFVVIGSEVPLSLGLADRLRAVGIKVFGPSKAASILESSKGFMKDLCKKYDIPTAAYERFSEAEPAKDFVRKQGVPIVVKADGLAAGKGVVVAQTLEEADQAINAILLDKCFGEAGNEIIIEEFLNGDEISFFALCDGETIVPFGSAQDHKRVGDGDTGPNTGGMGAYAPSPMMLPALERTIMHKIIHPTVEGMKKEGRVFQGVLFAGLMIDKAGNPKLIEFNIRFGDPECQVLMPLLKDDILLLLTAVTDKQLDLLPKNPQWHDETALCVVLASKGYPGSIEKNVRISNLETLSLPPKNCIFHASTKRDSEGAQDFVLATGGRVLSIVARANTVKAAQDKAYETVDRLDWKGGFCRRDIGGRAI